MAETLILTRREIARVTSPELILDALRQGFASTAMTDFVMGNRFPVRLPEPSPQGSSAMLLAPGFVPGIPAYTVKVHAKFPAEDQALKGVILLHSIDDGSILAILESTWLTNLRTGYAGALGTDVLARKDAGCIAIIGAGAQGRLQLECLAAVRKIDIVYVFDTIPGRAEAFAAQEGERLNLAVEAKSTIPETIDNADIIVTATWATEPFLTAEMIGEGTHITTLGPDQPGKAEISADLIAASFFVADDLELACRMGAIANVGLSADSVAASLGEVLAGQKPGRSTDDQITIFGAVGLPFQDLVVAWQAYTSAQAANIGSKINLLD